MRRWEITFTDGEVKIVEAESWVSALGLVQDDRFTHGSIMNCSEIEQNDQDDAAAVPG